MRLIVLSIGVLAALAACAPEVSSLCRPSGINAAKLKIGGQDYSERIVFVSVSDDYARYPVLNFRFDQAGAEAFAAQTTSSLGEPLDISVDGEVVSSPIVNEPILGGAGQISGQFSQEELNTLALRLAQPCE